MRALALAAAVGAAIGAFAVYAVDRREGDDDDRPALVRTLHDGEAVVRAGARCEASQEGAFENLYCTRVGGGRHSIVFYEDSVLVYGPEGEPTVPDLTLRWEPAGR